MARVGGAGKKAHQSGGGRGDDASRTGRLPSRSPRTGRSSAGSARPVPPARAGAGAWKEQPGAPGKQERDRGSHLQPVDGRDADALAPALDRLIHERMRLGIVAALAVSDPLSFNELKQLMHTTDGNLSVHARKLEEARYISCTKSFEGRVPHTQYSLTPLGRAALARYLDHMEALIRATRER